MSEFRRILFVDDELGVLEGLERMLFEMSDDWDMTFVQSADEALEELADEQFDVIVSDMRMPGMDGATLLARVHDEFPDVVRIILTGHCEMEATLRAMPVAHSFVTKPCNPDLLEAVVRRACNLRDILEDETVRTLVGGVAQLPVKPEVYTELTEAMLSPDIELSRVASIVGRDVGLSSKILHLTNSAFFGASRKFVSVNQAVSFVGMRMLKKVVLSAEVFRAFDKGKSSSGLSLEREQAHALACAGIAKAIAPEPAMADSAFLAGMLHDVGKLVWAASAPKLMRKIQKSKDEPLDAELAIGGTTHARVGAYLLGLWGLDEEIVEAVAFHHDPAALNSGELELAGVVHIADALAYEVSPNPSAKEELPQLSEEFLEKLGLLGQVDRWRRIAHELKGASET